MGRDADWDAFPLLLDLACGVASLIDNFDILEIRVLTEITIRMTRKLRCCEPERNTHMCVDILSGGVLQGLLGHQVQHCLRHTGRFVSLSN